MNSPPRHHLSSAQQVALIALRTAIGWHFLYEAYYKWMLPAWSAKGVPLGPWSSAAYLQTASGPLARLFQRLVSAGWVGWIDVSVKVGLLRALSRRSCHQRFSVGSEQCMNSAPIEPQ